MPSLFTLNTSEFTHVTTRYCKSCLGGRVIFVNMLVKAVNSRSADYSDRFSFSNKANMMITGNVITASGVGAGGNTWYVANRGFTAGEEFDVCILMVQ